jgi:tetratricopeptide (TPR) repeat protein
MMKRLILTLCLLVALTCTNLFSQSKAEIKNSFYDAESWILFEAYNDALPLYLQLLDRYPYNANFMYRIGQCYLNTPGEKNRAISYLEDAARKINPNYREGLFKESGAPYDVLYYLANAYRINNQLDKALETYEQFKKNLNSQVYDSVIVDLQIQSCLNAKELMGRPEFIKRSNLGSTVNSSNSEFNPVMSDDGNMLVFSRSEAFYDAILYSIRSNGQWSEPQNMNELLKVDRDIFPTSLSADGKTLYLYSSAEYDGIIYTSSFENGSWTLPVKLNYNINTKYWESHATVSHDNNKLYFTSNRKGSFGGLDIYVSKRDSTGDWGAAENLGPVINTPYNEESPFLSRDDKTLYFSSRGHYNMGGYDIFTSNLLENGQWSEPKNAGYPLNSTDDDVFYKPSVDSYRGFYAIDSPDGYGKEDIFQIEIYSDAFPRKFFIGGKATVEGLLSTYSDSVKISVMDVKSQRQQMIVYTNPDTKQYEFNVPQGNYKVDYEGYGGEKVSKQLDLPFTHPSDTFLIPETVLPRIDFTATLTLEGSRNLSVKNGDSLLFPLKVEPKSLLTVEDWAGNSLVQSEKLPVTSTLFNYKMVPVTGENRLVFTLTDRFNNTAHEEVFISRSKTMLKPVVRPEQVKVISNSRTAAYIVLLRKRADDKLSALMTESAVEKQEFKNSDDILSYLKSKAAGKNIKPDAVDKLALKVASMDNVLTQSAVDLLGNHSEGELKNILTGLDIHKTNLKTWSDLENYVSEKSGGRITSKDLNDLVTAILSEAKPEKVPVETVQPQVPAAEGNRSWLLWIIIGAAAIFVFIIFMRRRKKEKK